MSRGVRAVASDIARELRLLAKWWLHELQDTWHATLTRLLPRHADRVGILISQTQVQLRWRQSGREHERPLLTDTASVNGDPWEQMLSTLPGMLAEVRPGTRTRVHLDLSRVLLRDLLLPEVEERHLAAMVALQVERVLPLAPGTMYVDWRVVERLPERRRIAVTIAAAKRDWVDILRERITQAKLRVDQISAGGSPEKPLFNFSRLHTPWQAAGWERHDRVLCLSLAALSLIWVALSVGRITYERHRIADIVADEHARAQPAWQLERRIRDRAAPMRRVQHLLLTPTATDVIAILSQAIPVDTWVYSAEVSGGAFGGTPMVKLSGFTPTATMLVDDLSKNPALKAVKLVRATGTSGGIGIDHFEISAQLSTTEPSAKGAAP